MRCLLREAAKTLVVLYTDVPIEEFVFVTTDLLHEL